MANYELRVTGISNKQFMVHKSEFISAFSQSLGIDPTVALVEMKVEKGKVKREAITNQRHLEKSIVILVTVKAKKENSAEFLRSFLRGQLKSINHKVRTNMAKLLFKMLKIENVVVTSIEDTKTDISGGKVTHYLFYD